MDRRHTKPSDFALFTVTLTIDRARRIWTLMVRDTATHPVAAAVRIEGGAPHTGTAMRTRRGKTGSDGVFTIRTAPSTAGWWVVHVTIAARTGRDTVVFNLSG